MEKTLCGKKHKNMGVAKYIRQSRLQDKKYYQKQRIFHNNKWINLSGRHKNPKYVPSKA